MQQLYDLLLEAVAKNLYDSGETELVRKLIEQSTLIEKFHKTNSEQEKANLSKHELSTLEVQKVAAQVHKILKQPGFDFREFISYGENNILTNSQNRQEFSKNLDYETLSKLTYGGLFIKNGTGYVEQVEKFTEFCVVYLEDLAGNIQPDQDDELFMEPKEEHAPQHDSSDEECMHVIGENSFMPE